MGEAVSTSRALLLIAHHRERTEGKETQDRQGERCDDGLRYRNYRSEVILQELLAAQIGALLARPATVKSKVSRPKIDCCSPDYYRTAVR